MSTTLYLVRHGQSIKNTHKVVQGYEKDEANGLSEKGVTQAKEVALELAQVKFDICYHSPLRRARDTASHILSDIRIPLKDNQKLREKNQGDLAGMLMYDALAKYKGWEELSEDERLDLKIVPNEESQREFRARVLGVLAEIARENKDKCVLIVTHGGFLRSLYTYLENKTYADIYSFENCGYMVVEYDDLPKIIYTHKLSKKDKNSFK